MEYAVAEAVAAVTQERDEARAICTKQRNAMQEAVAAEREKGYRRIRGLIVRAAHSLGMTNLTDEQVKAFGTDDAIAGMALAERERHAAELAQERSNWRTSWGKREEENKERQARAVAAAYEEAARIADARIKEAENMWQDDRFDDEARRRWRCYAAASKNVAYDIRQASERAAKPQEEGPDVHGIVWPSHASECCCARCEAKAAYAAIPASQAAQEEKTPFDWPDEPGPVPGTFERNCAWWLI